MHIMRIYKYKYTKFFIVLFVLSGFFFGNGYYEYMERRDLVMLDVSNQCNDFDLYKFFMPLPNEHDYKLSKMYGYVNAVLENDGLVNIEGGHQIISTIEKIKSGNVDSIYMDGVDQTVFANKDELKDFVNLYNNAFGEYKGFTYKGAICMGQKKTVYWSINKNGEDYVRYFSFLNKNGKYLLSSPYIDSDLEALFSKIFSENISDVFKEDILLLDVDKNIINIFNHDGQVFSKLMIPDIVYVDKNIDAFSNLGGYYDSEQARLSVDFFKGLLTPSRRDYGELLSSLSNNRFKSSYKGDEIMRYKDMLAGQRLMYLLLVDPYVLVIFSDLSVDQIDSNKNIYLFYLLLSDGQLQQVNFSRKGYLDRVLIKKSDLYLFENKIRGANEGLNN